MILRYLSALAFFAGFLWFGQAYAQTVMPVDTLVDRIQKLNKHYNREKVHLHFDKSFYAPGDTIWFAGYVVNAINNLPTERSHILHVELIDDKSKMTKALQLPLNVGFAAGDIPLSDSLPGGNYHVRAYTNLMRNFEPGYFFNKSIRIIDPFPASVNPKLQVKHLVVTGNLQKADELSYDVQFFPEGGQLVNGLKSTVGFKAVAQTGLSVQVSGKLTDEAGNTVLDFKTAYAGMGAFTFTPATGKTYTALVKLPDGSEKRVKLPMALPSGYVLSADNSKPDSLYVTLQTTTDLINKADLTFIALVNGAPQFFMKTKFPANQINITAPKNKLPGGILQLTLLNAQNQPVAERLVFNNYRPAKISVEQFKTSYAKREKTDLALQVQDAAGKPLIGSFSMAVTNIDAIKPNDINETTILSNLLLSSELRGYIENPNYYFTGQSAAKQEELDHLMLTQGWRRFVWTEMPAAQLPDLMYAAEDKIVVSGQITGSAKANKKGVPITLLAGQLGNGVLLDTVTNEQGRFAFHVADSLADLPFRVQAKPKKMAEYEVNIDHYLPPAITDSSPNWIGLSGVSDSAKNQDAAADNYKKTLAANRTAYGNASLFKQATKLKEVVIKDNKPRPRIPNSHSSNLNGPGNADVVILPETLEKMPDLTSIDVLLPGVKVQPGGESMRLLSVVGTHAPDVLILVDGVDAGGGKFNLTSISPRDVESIEFMKNIAYSGIYGIRGSGGVLLITTKRGGMNYGGVTAKAPNSISFKLPVYLSRQFYSPQYDKPEKTKSIDLRTTVYWKPDMITNKAGKATVCFYNTDVSGNYRIVIEGISAKGDLCRQVFNYTVE